MLKKIFIGSIIFFILAVGIAGYFLFIKKSAPTTPVGVGGENNLPLGGPSGSAGSQNQNVITITASSSPQNGTVTLTSLLHISTIPVAGAASFIQGSTTYVRYIETGTGHITDVNLLAATTSRTTNRTFANTTDALWMNRGQNIVIRFPDAGNTHIISFTGSLTRANSTTTSNDLMGGYLPTNINSYSTSPDGSQLFFLTEDSSGSKGFITQPDGSKSSTVFSSPFSEWVSSWPNINTIALSTKPANSITGNLYFVDTKTHLMKGILGGINGLVALPNPTTNIIAYSDDNLVLSLYTVSTGETNGVIQTIADKCIWSKIIPTILYCGVPISTPPGKYPDDWYQGFSSFNDIIYKIDATTGQKSIVSNLVNTYKQGIDITNPSLSPDEKYLIFTNKKDGTLWSYRLAQ